MLHTAREEASPVLTGLWREIRAELLSDRPTAAAKPTHLPTYLPGVRASESGGGGGDDVERKKTGNRDLKSGVPWWRVVEAHVCFIYAVDV